MYPSAFLDTDNSVMFVSIEMGLANNENCIFGEHELEFISKISTEAKKVLLYTCAIKAKL